jgi:hypothetical protein
MRAVSRKLPSIIPSCLGRQSVLSTCFIKLNSTPRFILRSSCLPLRADHTHYHTLQAPHPSICFNMTAQAPPPAELPWYASDPEARSKPASISRSEVLELLQTGKDDDKFVLVDLRRTDYEVYRGSEFSDPGILKTLAF